MKGLLGSDKSMGGRLAVKCLAVILCLSMHALAVNAPLTNQSILKLTKAGIGVDVMVAMIENQPGDYSVDPDSVIELKSAGVPEKVITAMIRNSGNAGKEAGAGDGSGVFSVGNGTTPPRIIKKSEPIYTRQALAAKLSGSVGLSFVVNTDGEAEDIKIIHGLGMGLDERAVEAVKTWRWVPGTNKGAPVKVHAHVEVNFRVTR